MLLEIDIQTAKKIWDSSLLKMPNYNFYQSFSNGMIEGINEREPRYIIYCQSGNIKLMALCLYNKEITSIPFGPIINSDIDETELFEILCEIEKYFGNQLIFSLNEHDCIKYFNLAKNNLFWEFTTCLLDTKFCCFEDLFNNFNTNRKRIVKRCLIELKDCYVEENDNNIDAFYDLYIKRLTENNCEISFNADYIKHIVNYNNTGVVVCKNSFGRILSGIIYYQFGDTLISRHNAFDSTFGKLNPGTFLDIYMIKKILSNPQLQYYDMSGLATGNNIDQKSFNINRYKKSYGASKTLTYKWMYFDKKRGMTND